MEDGACVISRMAADVYKKGAACGTRVAEGVWSVGGEVSDVSGVSRPVCELGVHCVRAWYFN